MAVDPAARHVQIEVARALPKLAKASQRWTRVTICPRCMGPKNRRAFFCRACSVERRRMARALHKQRAFREPNVDKTNWSHHKVQWRHAGTGGEVRPQPERERLILGLDRVWRTELDHASHIKAEALAALDVLTHQGEELNA